MDAVVFRHPQREADLVLAWEYSGTALRFRCDMLHLCSWCGNLRLTEIAERQLTTRHFDVSCLHEEPFFRLGFPKARARACRSLVLTQFGWE
jgi:hypothetical protein